MVRLDDTNLRLLEILERDARTSVSDLARAVNRAETTVRERIAALEREGVLRGYRAVVDPEKLGHGARAFVLADCDRRGVPELARRLAAVPQVAGAWLTTGPRPLLLEALAPNLARLEQALEERIAPLDVAGLEAAVVVRTLVEPRSVAVQANLAAARAAEVVEAVPHPPRAAEGLRRKPQLRVARLVRP